MICRPILLLTPGLLIAGCSSASRLAQRDEERCAARGLQPNTEAYTNCLASLETERKLRMDARHRELVERSDTPYSR
jgi:putative hemolysin